MSIKALNWAWDLDLSQAKKCTSATKLVLLSLADYSNNVGLCYPSVNSISNSTNLTTRSVIKHIGLLKDLGIVKSTARYDDDKSRTSNMYKLDLAIDSVNDDNTVSRARENYSHEVVNNVHTNQKEEHLNIYEYIYSIPNINYKQFDKFDNFLDSKSDAEIELLKEITINMSQTIGYNSRKKQWFRRNTNGSLSYYVNLYSVLLNWFNRSKKNGRSKETSRTLSNLDSERNFLPASE